MSPEYSGPSNYRGYRIRFDTSDYGSPNNYGSPSDLYSPRNDSSGHNHHDSSSDYVTRSEHLSPMYIITMSPEYYCSRNHINPSD